MKIQPSQAEVRFGQNLHPTRRNDRKCHRPVHPRGESEEDLP